MIENRRIEWIDALRGFAIVLVLLGHIPGIPDWLFKWIYAFHIPLFFVISGYLYNQEKWKELGLKNLVISKAKSHLLPFIVISISISIIEIVKLLIFSNVIYWEEFFKYVFDYLKWILFQIDGDFCGSLIAGLWFLPTLFISTIMLYLINSNKYKKIVYCVIASILILVVKYYSLTNIPWHLDVALLGSMYMMFGIFIKAIDVIDKVRNVSIIVIAIFMSNILIALNTLIDLKKHIYGNYILMILSVLLVSASLIYIFCKYNIKNTVLELFGKYSLVVISLNFIINRLLEKILVFSSDFWWIIFGILEYIIFIVIILISKKLFRKFPKLGIVFGYRI